MKRWLSYIVMAVLCGFYCSSCSDETFEGQGPDTGAPVVRLTIALPGTSRAIGGYEENVYPDNLDSQTEGQRSIDANDIYVLQFVNDKLYHVITDLTISQPDGAQERTLTGHILSAPGSTELVVLANLNQQEGIEDITAENLLASYKGQAQNEIYENLIYSYPTANWKLENNKLPMWGTTGVISISSATEARCNLYRGVAKMGVQVDEYCTNFQLKEIYVYRINDKGYCAAPTQKPSSDMQIQFSETDIPETASPRTAPLKYVVPESEDTDYIVTGKRFLNQIYLSEVKNAGTDPDKQLKVVVGGIYEGEGIEGAGKMNYYRIDMKDDKGGGVADFDIIRNHSYVFNITKVVNPGTPTPDEALENDVVTLTVAVDRWADDYMRGVPDQYTLTTDKSVITCSKFNDVSAKTLDIWTDYSDGWYIEPIADEDLSWLTIDRRNGSANNTTTVSVTPNFENRGITRTTRFYVVAGSIKKEITVIMPQPPTANCYIVGEGEHELIVSIKGNGNDGIAPEGKNIVPGNGDAALTPVKIGVIWETEAGLIQLKDAGTGSYVSNTQGRMTYADYDPNTNSIKYTVNLNGASIGGVTGGNALIGAFNDRDQVVWSWHIWVAPDMIDPSTQEVYEHMVENWTLNDYDVLDRNLGALSNKPEGDNSVASMGLLYQWGRKDPFIGAGHSNDDFTGTGVLPVVHYYEGWGVQNGGSIRMDDNAIPTTIQHPTRLVYGGGNSSPTGLSSIPGYGGYLWGTNNGLSTTVKDLGSKTIYDPCPVGYRVPPVDAFVFSKKGEKEGYRQGAFIEEITIPKRGSKSYGKPVYYQRWNSVFEWWNDLDLQRDGTLEGGKTSERKYRVYEAVYTTYWETLITSETENWRLNVMYVPHYVNNMSDTRIQWGDNSDVGNIYLYDGSYVKKADYYGFYLNYESVNEPKLTTDKKRGYYGSNNNADYYYNPVSGQPVTWLPLTGAYDPTKGFSFKNGGSTISIEQGSSITVNSFLWTNSSVQSGSEWIPGAMFLHGTETGGGGSGRHIHGLTKTDIRAEPHYAGTVRCVRDRAKTKWDINSLTSSASISRTVGSTTTISIVSVNATWELVNPGAPWLQVTPDSGNADKGRGTTITLKMLKEMPSGTSTTLAFRIANETEDREVTVTVN